MLLHAVVRSWRRQGTLHDQAAGARESSSAMHGQGSRNMRSRNRCEGAKNDERATRTYANQQAANA